jgi:hypothetical protein
VASPVLENICGAVTGAIMVIGMKYDKATPENKRVYTSLEYLPTI